MVKSSHFAWWNPAYLTLNPHLFIPSWYTQASGLFLKPASSCSTSRRFTSTGGVHMIYPGIDVYIDVEKKYPQTWKSMHPLRWRQNNVRDTAQSGNQIRQCKTSMVSLGKWSTVIVPDLLISDCIQENNQQKWRLYHETIGIDQAKTGDLGSWPRLDALA
jgi:hypothetical protein